MKYDAEAKAKEFVEWVRGAGFDLTWDETQARLAHFLRVAFSSGRLDALHEVRDALAKDEVKSEAAAPNEEKCQHSAHYRMMDHECRVCAKRRSKQRHICPHCDGDHRDCSSS